MTRQMGAFLRKMCPKLAAGSEKRPHQRPSGGRELAGMRKLAKRLRRVAGSSKFGIARERLEQAGFGAEPQSKKNRISGLAEGANLLECENLRKDCGELREAASSV